MDLLFLLDIPLCKCTVAKNPYSTATCLCSTMVCFWYSYNTSVNEWKQEWKQSSCCYWKGSNKWSKDKISCLSSPHFLLPSNQFPTGVSVGCENITSKITPYYSSIGIVYSLCLRYVFSLFGTLSRLVQHFCTMLVQKDKHMASLELAEPHWNVSAEVLALSMHANMPVCWETNTNLLPLNISSALVENFWIVGSTIERL